MSIRIQLVVLAVGLGACQALPFFEPQPLQLCDRVDQREQVVCGPCNMGLKLRRCGNDFRWHDDSTCLDNPYDLDGDGYANETCEAEEDDDSCCGLLDCDDAEANRYPGQGDLDGDEHIDVRCGGDDCNDDNAHIWFGHADADGDGHDDVRCCNAEGVCGDDCDDTPTIGVHRWNGHADVDGDGHTDARCCLPGTPMCDDCNDDDPRRWGSHADLDEDGHDDERCGGDDCDDSHPLRWRGHADVDGDGHVDDRCCDPMTQAACDDCNDNDPSRWTGHSDLDEDGHHDYRCRCDAVAYPDLCDDFDDCDDDCSDCQPGGEPTFGEALDHDCNGIVDDLWEPIPEFDELTITDTVDTGDSRAVAVAGSRAFVGTVEGVWEVDLSRSGRCELRGFLSTPTVNDIVLWGELVLVATTAGLVVIRRALPTAMEYELLMLATLSETGHSHAVDVSDGLAYVGSYAGLYEVDLASPEAPAVISFVGAPVIRDVRDVFVARNDRWGHFVYVVSRSTLESPDIGGLSLLEITGGGALEPYRFFEMPGTRRVAYAGNDDIFVVTRSGIIVVYYAGTAVSQLTCEGINHITHPSADLSYFVATVGGLRFESLWWRSAWLPTGASNHVELSNDRVYVATSEGLQVVSLQ